MFNPRTSEPPTLHTNKINRLIDFLFKKLKRRKAAVSSQAIRERYLSGGKVAVWYSATPEHSSVPSSSFLIIGAGHLKCPCAGWGDESWRRGSLVFSGAHEDGRPYLVLAWVLCLTFTPSTFLALGVVTVSWLCVGEFLLSGLLPSPVAGLWRGGGGTS